MLITFGMTPIERYLPCLSLMCVSLLYNDFNIYLDSVKDALFLHFPLKLPYKQGKFRVTVFFNPVFWDHSELYASYLHLCLGCVQI